jgi:CheY-like chemotaxis protein
MQSTATVPAVTQADRSTNVALLLADDEPSVRTAFAARANRAIERLTVLEAADGAQAVRIGVQQRPCLALLDIQMPCLGGIEAALTLRELDPDIALALYSADPAVHRKRAREEGFPVFHKLDLEEPLQWLKLQVRTLLEPPRARLQRHAFECSVCRYGAVRPAPPERCPMCQREGTWTESLVSPPLASTATVREW